MSVSMRQINKLKSEGKDVRLIANNSDRVKELERRGFSVVGKCDVSTVLMAKDGKKVEKPKAPKTPKDPSKPKLSVKDAN